MIGGNHTSEIFIENGRFHGKQIAAALTGAPLPVAHHHDHVEPANGAGDKRDRDG